MKLIAQMVKVSATEVAEFEMLKMPQNTFIRILFWGVSRETLQVNFLRPGIDTDASLSNQEHGHDFCSCAYCISRAT